MYRKIEIKVKKSTIDKVIELQEILKNEQPILQFMAALLEQHISNEKRRILNERYQ